MVKVHFEPDETKKAELHAKMQTGKLKTRLYIFEVNFKTI